MTDLGLVVPLVCLVVILLVVAAIVTVELRGRRAANRQPTIGDAMEQLGREVHDLGSALEAAVVPAVIRASRAFEDFAEQLRRSRS